MLRGIFRSDDHAVDNSKPTVMSKEEMQNTTSDFGKTILNTATDAFKKLAGQGSSETQDFPTLNDYGKQGDPEIELDIERFVGEGGSAEVEKNDENVKLPDLKNDEKAKVVAVRYPVIKHEDKKPTLKQRVFAMRSLSECSPSEREEHHKARFIADREGHIFTVSMDENELKIIDDKEKVKAEPAPRKTSWDRQWLDEKAKELTETGRHIWSTTQHTLGAAAEKARLGAHWAAEEAKEIGDATGEAANRVVDHLYDEDDEIEERHDTTPASLAAETTDNKAVEADTILPHPVSDVVHAVYEGAKSIAEEGMHIAVGTARVAYEGAEIVAEGLKEAGEDAITGVSTLLHRNSDDEEAYSDEDAEYPFEEYATNFAPDPLDVPSSYPRGMRRPIRPPTPPRSYPKEEKEPKQEKEPKLTYPKAIKDPKLAGYMPSSDATMAPPRLPNPTEANKMPDRSILKPKREMGPLGTPDGAQLDASAFVREHRPSPPPIPPRHMNASEATVQALKDFKPIPPIGKVPTGPLSATNALADTGNQPPSYASVAKGEAHPTHETGESAPTEQPAMTAEEIPKDCRATMKQNEPKGDSFHHGPLPHLF